MCEIGVFSWAWVLREQPEGTASQWFDPGSFPHLLAAVWHRPQTISDASPGMMGMVCFWNNHLIVLMRNQHLPQTPVTFQGQFA